MFANDSDSDGDQLNIGSHVGPSHGYLMIFEDGHFTYRPDPDFFGTDSFTYTLWDDTASSAPATVHLTVTPVSEYIEIAGDTRYDTAADAALTGWQDGGAETVVLATGRNFPDALGGSALAGALDAPLLLVDTDAIPASIADAMKRLQAKHAIVLGGKSVVTEDVSKAALAAMGAGSTVERVGGSTRYETARLVAKRAIDEQSSYDRTAFVATGLSFPDALAAGPISAAAGWPVYLVGSENASTIAAMKAHGVKAVKVIGGTGAVSKETYDALAAAFGSTAVKRVAGGDRYDTAAKIADLAPGVGMHWEGVGLATGESFPDALTAGALLGRSGSPLLLSKQDALSEAARLRLWAKRAEISNVRFFGGTSALGAAVRAKAKQTVEAP